MKVTGFNHLTIRVSDLDKSLSFYRDLLGMELIHQGQTDVYLEWETAWICLIAKKNAASPAETWTGIDHVAFSIEESDFHQAVKLLKENKVPLFEVLWNVAVDGRSNFLTLMVRC
jgi:metallothiol transferase